MDKQSNLIDQQTGLDSLPKDLIIYLGNKLSDKDLLSLSEINKRYNGIIKSWFKEYVSVFTNSTDLLCTIERQHPKFNKIINNTTNYKYYRFLAPTNILSIWLTTFRYRISRRSTESDPTSWSGNEYKKYLKQKTISEDDTHFIHTDYDVAKQNILSQVQTKVIDVLNSNNVLIYNDKSDADNNPKTDKEILAEVSNKLYDPIEKNKAHLQIDGCGTYYTITMQRIDLSNELNLCMKGHWKGLLGKTVKKKTMKKMLKNAKKYRIQDNGGRPFNVIHKKKNVTIIKKSSKTVVMKYKNVKRVLPGEEHDEEYIGNSVLVDLGDNKYVWIGWNIYEFTTPDQKKIKRFYSQMGNSNVPYPVAVSKTNVYFMLDHVYVPKSDFVNYDDWYDAYSYFFGHTGPTQQRMEGTKFPNFTMVHARCC